MEIHQAPGPPRMNVIVVAGTRVAELEVCPGRHTGSVRQADGTRWTLEQPPGASEWWVAGEDGEPIATLEHPSLFGERFTVQIAVASYRIVPCGSAWRRRWRVVDDQDRELLDVVQRPLARSVHDLRRRSGDVPQELPMLVAWTLALATSAPMPETRRPRWTVH
jgi:hypothetical protein